MTEISKRYIDKYWVVAVRKLFYFHHCVGTVFTKDKRRMNLYVLKQKIHVYFCFKLFSK